MAELLEVQTLTEPPARLVVIEEHSKKCRYAEAGARIDHPLHEQAAKALVLASGRDVHAHLGRRVIRVASPIERAQFDPGDDFALDFRHPERSAVRIVFREPLSPAVHGDWLEVGGGRAARDRRVVDLDDPGQVLGRSVTDDHCEWPFYGWASSPRVLESRGDSVDALEDGGEDLVAGLLPSSEAAQQDELDEAEGIDVWITSEDGLPEDGHVLQE